jgi:predicted RND superfamily exporter protein
LTSDIRWLEMLPSGDPTIAVTRRCDEKLGGALLVSAIVEWPEGESLESAEVIDVVSEVQETLQASPELSGAFSVRDLLAAFSAEEAIDGASFRHLRRVPPKHLHRLLREDLRRTVVTARVPDVGAARLLPEFDRLAARLAGLEARHPGFVIRLTGTAVTAARAVYQIIEDTRTSLFTSAAIILAMTVVAFRSLRYGLLCVIPNLFPLLATSAALVAVGEPLRLASAVTFSIALGLADDSAIHFVSAFLRGRRDGLGTRAALERVLATSGRAMIIAALTLAAGMAPLLFCRLAPLRTFAALSIFAILAALVADFFILPSVLACFAGDDTVGVSASEGSRDPPGSTPAA